jgi:hypothetical protein
MITGVLKESITLGGINYKKGDTITIAKNLGLENYLEKKLEFKKGEKDDGNIKTNR